METETTQINHLAVELGQSGEPLVSLQSKELKIGEPLPQGFATIETIQAGTCTSEIHYYHSRDEGPSRFAKDSTNKDKRADYTHRNVQAGYSTEEENVDKLQELMTTTMFHEGFGIIREANPNTDRPKIPVQKFVPEKDANGKIGFVKKIIYTNFQEELEPGRLAVRNPAVICDKHSSAENINPETGWPYQCHRNEEEGHINKGTIGHTEFIGAAVEGELRVQMDSLTPVPKSLQEFVEQDMEKRATLLTSIEPIGCVYDAFGTMLQSGERPESVVIIGDGPNALNTLAFLQVFSPDADIVVVGKHKAKLDCFKTINPDKITVMTTDGNDYSDLEETLTLLNGHAHADVVMPTVTLPEDVVAPFVNDNGTLIWWAASVSEVANGDKQAKRYKERFPYGGAPRAELSAVDLMDYFVKERPEIVEALLTYPGVIYTEMDEDGAADIQEWLTNHGRLVREVETPTGKQTMSVKPIINTKLLHQLAAARAKQEQNVLVH